MIVLARPVLGGKVGDEKLRAETMFPFTLNTFWVAQALGQLIAVVECSYKSFLPSSVCSKLHIPSFSLSFLLHDSVEEPKQEVLLLCWRSVSASTAACHAAQPRPRLLLRPGLAMAHRVRRSEIERRDRRFNRWTRGVVRFLEQVEEGVLRRMRNDGRRCRSSRLARPLRRL